MLVGQVPQVVGEPKFAAFGFVKHAKQLLIALLD